MDVEDLRRKRRRLFFSAAPASQRGVIDLTGDTPEPEDITKMTDDEAYARRLQAEFDDEDGDAMPQPVASSSRGHIKRRESELEDERVARGLQAQFDFEQPAIDGRSRTLFPDAALTTPSKGQPMPTGPVISAREVENTLRTLHISIRGHKCQQCAKSLFKHDKDVLSFFNSLMEQPTPVALGVVCPDCQMSSRTENDQLVLVWTILCGFDHTSKHNKANKEKRSTRSNPSAPKGKGVGYGGSNRPSYDDFDPEEFDPETFDSEELDPDKALDNLQKKKAIFQNFQGGPTPAVDSTGNFATGSVPPGLLSYHYGHSHPDASKTAAKKSPSKHRSKATKTAEPPEDKLSDDDKMTAKVFWCLSQLLPTFDKESEFDTNPPAEKLRCVLLGSFILERAADLFRNNNLEEVIEQAELYTALVGFVRTLAQHTVTSLLVFGERVARSPGVSNLKAFGKTDRTKGPDTTQSLIRCMRELAVQCRTMMKSSELSQAHMEILHSIAELNDFLTANAGAEMINCRDKNAWQKDLAVSEVVDEAIIPKHKLSQIEPQGIPSQHGRMSRIMQEIARLQSSLPDGIFIRYAASRPDIMKILIIGPKDTPYENGVFEFDMLCGPKFPYEPPKMDFRTTGGGRVHFNPNLYPDGKVCLSLLGTWAGESWDPKKSTLLQVLVSIQAMIFCDNPWNNEPGRENVPKSDYLSRSYNRGLYHHTVQTAMLDWLERRRYTPHTTTAPLDPFQTLHSVSTYEQRLHGPRETDGTIDNTEDIWDEVIKRHFDAVKDEILETVTKWIADKAPPPPRAPRTGSISDPLSYHGAPTYFPGLHPPPFASNNQATVSNGPTFSGTGWQGRTLGSDEGSKSDTKSEDPAAGPLVGDNLAAKLRGAVATLKKNAGRYRMMDT